MELQQRRSSSQLLKSEREKSDREKIETVEKVQPNKDQIKIHDEVELEEEDDDYYGEEEEAEQE